MVSIIIPAYNVEKYIFRAIESCIEQTYKDIEIIIVDDGSIDNTFGIISEYAERDYRIRIYRQQNKGVSVARNRGIKESRGDFLIFLDADDWMETDTVETLMQNCQKGYLLCVCMKLVRLQEDDRLDIIFPPKKIKDTIVKKDRLIKCFCCCEYLLGSACYKLFDRKILFDNKIEFNSKIHNGEDGLFVFRYLLCVEGLIYKDKPLWNILERKDSATSSEYNFKMSTAIDAADILVNYTEYSLDNEQYVKYYYTQRAIVMRRIAARTRKRLSKNKQKKLDKAVKRYVKNYLITEHSYSKKIKALIVIYSPLFILRWILITYSIFRRDKN